MIVYTPDPLRPGGLVVAMHEAEALAASLRAAMADSRHGNPPAASHSVETAIEYDITLGRVIKITTKTLP